MEDCGYVRITRNKTGVETYHPHEPAQGPQIRGTRVLPYGNHPIRQDSYAPGGKKVPQVLDLCRAQCHLVRIQRKPCLLKCT